MTKFFHRVPTQQFVHGVHGFVHAAPLAFTHVGTFVELRRGTS
jgi:hypothetical protein